MMGSHVKTHEEMAETVVETRKIYCPAVDRDLAA
jgi:hypothetical protein